jgi:hypothetical protein
MIENIRHMKELQAAHLPVDGFAVVHSAWLTLMGMRPNGDLDLIMTSALRRKQFGNPDPERHFGLPGPLVRRIRIMPMINPYGGFYGAQGIDDVISNYCIEIDGIRFIEPRFYFAFKKQRLRWLRDRQRDLPWLQRSLLFPFAPNRILRRKIAKDENDFAWINGFFDQDSHCKAAFQHIPHAAWGLPDRDWQPSA